MTSRGGKRTAKLRLPSGLRQGRDGIGDGRANICAHDHGNRHRKRQFAARHHRHDQRCRDRTALCKRRCENPGNQTHERISCRENKAVDGAFAQPLDAAGQSGNAD